jgi:hypothetical protein
MHVLLAFLLLIHEHDRESTVLNLNLFARAFELCSEAVDESGDKAVAFLFRRSPAELALGFFKYSQLSFALLDEQFEDVPRDLDVGVRADQHDVAARIDRVDVEETNDDADQLSFQKRDPESDRESLVQQVFDFGFHPDVCQIDLVAGGDFVRARQRELRLMRIGRLRESQQFFNPLNDVVAHSRTLSSSP